VNLDEPQLRRRLRDELSGLPVPYAPVESITRRGRAVRSRRRLAAACAAAVAVAVAALLAIPALRPGGLLGGPAVTMNAPDPNAPGGEFASGTAFGRTWRLAVRNIAAPGLGCLAAVTLNGHQADILPGRGTVASSAGEPVSRVGYVGFLTLLPAAHGAGFGFVAVHPGVTKVTVRLADRSQLDAQPVAVTRCGTRFQLAGFAYADANPTRITAFSGQTQTGTSATGWVPFAGHYHTIPPAPPTGMWETTPDGPSRPVFAGVAAQGTAGGVPWRIDVELGGGICHGLATSAPRATAWTACWNGDCFIASANEHGTARWQSQTCVPIEPSPAVIRLTHVPAIGASLAKGGPPSPELTAYAGLVGARTAHAVAYLSDGTTRRLTPRVVGGRKYIALAVAKRLVVTKIELFDAARHGFAALTSMPTSCGVTPVPACGAFTPR
jgi:hypothetical protein